MPGKTPSDSAINLIDRARAHFDKMRGQTIEVPEWGLEGPNAAKFDPPSLATRQVIHQRAGKSESRQFAITLILCLKDADGAPLFADDKESLAALTGEFAPEVVARIYNRIVAVSTDADLGN